MQDLRTIVKSLYGSRDYVNIRSKFYNTLDNSLGPSFVIASSQASPLSIPMLSITAVIFSDLAYED